MRVAIKLPSDSINPDNQELQPSELLSNPNLDILDLSVDLALIQSINLCKASILGVLIFPLSKAAIF